jgi:hypothetical protein
LIRWWMPVFELREALQSHFERSPLPNLESRSSPSA